MSVVRFHDEGLIETDSEFIEGYTDALSFNGIDSYVEIPNSSSIITTPNITIEMTINPKTWIGTHRALLSSRNGTTPGILIFKLGTDNTSLAIDMGGVSNRWTTTYLPPTNEWTNIAVTFDGTTTSLYVNGEFHSSQVIGLSSSMVSPKNIFIGRDTLSQYYYDGMIKNIRIWSVARTQQQLADNLNRDVTGDVGLLTYWPFDDTYATNLSDRGGNNYNGTISPTTTRVNTQPLTSKDGLFAIKGELIEARSDGELGYSFDPNMNMYTTNELSDGSTNGINLPGSTNSHIGIPTSPSLDVVDAITIETWVKNPSTLAHNQMVITKDSSYVMSIGTTGQLGAAISTVGKLWGWTYSGPVITDNIWHHVAVVYDQVSIKFYVDGILTTNLAYAWGAITPGTSGLGIGTRKLPATGNVGSSVEYYKGSVMEPRIWNVARTQTQIIDSMNKKLVGNETGLVGYWPFDEKTGTVALDKTINANNGTIYNSCTRIFE